MAGNSLYNPVKFQDLLLSERIISGDTIILLNDNSDGDITINFNGSSLLKTTIKPYNGKRIINGGGVYINGNNLRFENCEFYFKDWVQRQSVNDDYEGIDQTKIFDIRGHDVTFYRCIIHDFVNIGWWSHPDNINSKFTECIIYYNGWDGITRGHGYNLYTQNEYGRKQLERCIMFSSFRNNIHINASSKINRGYDLTDCILFNAGTPANIPTEVNEVLIGSSSGNCNDFHFQGCELFGDNLTLSSWGIFAGYNIPIINYTVRNCYIDVSDVTILYSVVQKDNSLISDNYLFGYSSEELKRDFPNNIYGVRPVTGKRVRIIKCDGDRGYVVIYNYDLDNTVDVDLTNILVTGDNYSLTNVQDKDVDIVTGVVGFNNTISVAMTGRTIASPILTANPPSSFPLFGCFIIEKLV